MKKVKVSESIILCLVLSLLVSCATSIEIRPPVSTSTGSIDFTLYGPIEYEGNWNYVPKTISNTLPANSELSFKYAYQITYGGTTPNEDAIALFIPTTIIGTPTGKDDMQVAAKLEVYSGQGLVKTYTAVCTLTKHRGIYAGGINLTELRQQGLRAVKENIEMQMVQDKAFLISLTSSKKGEASQ
jgi:hypothetical protein